MFDQNVNTDLNESDNKENTGSNVVDQNQAKFDQTQTQTWASLTTEKAATEQSWTDQDQDSLFFLLAYAFRSFCDCRVSYDAVYTKIV